MEQYPASITIGGALPAELVEEFIQRCREDGAGPEWDGGMPDEVKTAEDLLKLLDNKGHLHLMYSQACYGRFSAVEEFLEGNKVPFDAHNDSHHDGTEASYSVYRPELPDRVLVESNNHGSQLITLGPVLEAAQALDAGNIHAAQALLDRALGHIRRIPILPKFTIVNYATSHGTTGDGRAPH